ncbi:MAG TPA: glycosyltransferase family 4 protein [Allosphingosinicella sp.]|nr:glycosyltransferase family 4 protein [Allosphingosinicella sp.]
MRRNLRILMDAEAGGRFWPYTLDLALGLSRLGHETFLAVMGSAPTPLQRADAARVPGLTLVETGLAAGTGASAAASLAPLAEALAGLADEVEADILHLNSPALAALADFGLPVVAAQHGCVATWWEAVHGGELPADLAWRADQVRAGLHSADIVVAPTTAFAASVQRRYALSATPRAVHYGRRPVAPAREFPRDFVFTAGRLWDPGKNLQMLDAAAAELGVPVKAAGPVARPGGREVLFDNIECLGSLAEEELRGWLAARPVFVSTALYEPFGLSVLEAAAAGCPLILSDIPAFRELWDDVAIFVEPDDEPGFTRAIANLVADDFERAVLGRAARERALRYAPDAAAAQMAAIYRSLLPAVMGPVLAAAREAA